MKLLQISLAVYLVILSLGNFSYAQPTGTRPVPKYFTDHMTRLRFLDSKWQKRGERCFNICKRRDVRTWSSSDWDLYYQLFTEHNRRGYLNDTSFFHQLDCFSDGQCQFHFTKHLLPWHRLLTAHFEQTLQMIDHQINPWRAHFHGEFCLAYWDWGWQAPFSNNLEDGNYTYLFNKEKLGTLIGIPNNGTPLAIPNGRWANLQVPPWDHTTNASTTRCPNLGASSWNRASVSSCLAINNLDAGDPTLQTPGGDPRKGFRDCLELLPHNGIHLGVGCGFTAFTSPRDPVFWLHHSMTDYLWWNWLLLPNKTIGSDWNTLNVQPYNQWFVNETVNNWNLCYTYEPYGSARQNKSYGQTTIPGDYNSDPTTRDAVNDVLYNGVPTALEYQRYLAFLRHLPFEWQRQILYNQYIQSVQHAYELYTTIRDYYFGSRPRSQQDYHTNVTVATYLISMTGVNNYTNVSNEYHYT